MLQFRTSLGSLLRPIPRRADVDMGLSCALLAPTDRRSVVAVATMSPDRTSGDRPLPSAAPMGLRHRERPDTQPSLLMVGAVSEPRARRVSAMCREAVPTSEYSVIDGADYSLQTTRPEAVAPVGSPSSSIDIPFRQATGLRTPDSPPGAQPWARISGRPSSLGVPTHADDSRWWRPTGDSGTASGGCFVEAQSRSALPPAATPPYASL